MVFGFQFLLVLVAGRRAAIGREVGEYVLWNRQTQTIDDLSNFAISTRISFLDSDGATKRKKQTKRKIHLVNYFHQSAAKRFVMMETPGMTLTECLKSEQARCES